ncbi:MAG: diaminopimelate decarboxylase [Proteobacteria bacterium]|nr:diaminopimelate decarboxylase [Pseudomonadota bacterium]
MKHYYYKSGDLWAEDVRLTDILSRVGTPCYVYSEAAIIKQWQAFDSALAHHPHKICYAVKANSNLAVLNTLAQLGSGFDIVSGGELARVIAAKGKPNQVVFSGVGKQALEIIQALKYGIFCFNIESAAELQLINQLAEHHNLLAPIAFRINPDVDPKSHPYISTGLKENKFGIDFAQAIPLYQDAKKLKHIEVKGITFHIGSQLTSLSPFIDATKRILTLIEQLKSVGINLQYLDVGGGLGIRYQDETPPSPKAYIDALLALCIPPELTLILEPGRSIVGDAGILITQVLLLKQAGNKQFCIVDCAMNDLLRPTLYQAWQNIIPLKEQALKTLQYDVVGPVCESGDFLGLSRRLAIEPGDYLAITEAGAYGFVMSSNYNSRPRAPEVMIKGEKFKLIRERETIQELFAKEYLFND